MASMTKASIITFSRPNSGFQNYTLVIHIVNALPKINLLRVPRAGHVAVLNQRLRAGVELKSVTLETLSSEVVIGLMGPTIMNPI